MPSLSSLSSLGLSHSQVTMATATAYLTKIDVLYLWKFNKQHGRAKLTIIFLYITELLEIMTVADSEAK